MDENPYEAPREEPVDRPPVGRPTNWKWVGIAVVATVLFVIVFIWMSVRWFFDGR